jgi:ketosteroid isomerase-like protein
MSDVDQIARLVHAYARLLDRGDVDGVSALFEHSTWRTLPAGTILQGSAEVRPVYERLLADGVGSTRHLLTNLAVDVDPGGTAACSHCYWTVLAATPGRPLAITLSGQYTDAFEKVDGAWRFVDRLITTDMTASTSDG